MRNIIDALPEVRGTQEVDVCLKPNYWKMNESIVDSQAWDRRSGSKAASKYACTKKVTQGSAVTWNILASLISFSTGYSEL